ncbi:MAG: mandelate racemase/muconate lactonizing enzyme family protein [Chloroflexota bacterium]
MKITALETMHADGGGRAFDFLKLSTDEGLVGWSEYNEGFGGLGVTQVIERLAPVLIGKDPRAIEAHVALMQALRRVAAGGVNQQAIGAIENALVDVKAKALGIPVYELLGGPVRDTIRLYWSHCGSYRVGPRATALQAKPVESLDDIVALGKEVVASGFTGLKTNVILFDDTPRGHVPGFARGEGFPELNPDRKVVDAIRAQLAAFREGTGPDIDILVDLNYNYKTEGYLKMARAMEEFDLFWVELDMRNARAMRYIREGTKIPVASCETLYTRREFIPFFEAGSVDTAIVDVPYNGILESMKIAAMADAYDVNVAPHNFYSPLASTISSHFAATVPNLRIMEIDNDVVPWYHDLVTVTPKIENGHLKLGSGPGWGTEVNEDVVRAHPARG